MAARGIDISGIPFVVNLTLPDEQQSYVHRIGRVGRADRMGLAISLVSKVKEKVCVGRRGGEREGRREREEGGRGGREGGREGRERREGEEGGKEGERGGGRRGKEGERGGREGRRERRKGGMEGYGGCDHEALKVLVSRM